MPGEFQLRKKKPTPAPAAQQAHELEGNDALPQTPALPFVPGNIILGDRERRDLQVLGYKEGDPLPGNLPQLIANAKEAAAQELNEALAATSQRRQTFKAPREIPLDQLPPEHLQTLKKAMEDAKKRIDYAELYREEMAAMARLDPSVRRTIMAARGQDNGGLHLPEAAEDDAPEPQPAAKQPRPRSLPEPAPQPQPAAEKPAHEHKENCPHCNWKLDQPDPTEPSAGDLLAYVAAWGEQPFVKCYEFFGGRLRVTLRDPSIRHTELVYTQLTLDSKSGQLVSVDDFWRRLNDYRLVVSLDSLYVNGKTIRFGDELDRFIKEEPAPTQEVYDGNGVMTRVLAGDTALPQALETLMETPPLQSETIWRICLTACQRFAALVKKIEARSEDPDFLKAIGG